MYVGIMALMSPRRRSEPIADLFSKSGVKAPRKQRPALPGTRTAKPTQASEPRPLLPKNLAGALKRLDDAEIDSLVKAVVEEARRRDRLPAGLSASSMNAKAQQGDLPQGTARKKPAKPQSVKRETDERAALLKQGQINAVRAAFKAGVKPATIARKFGLSQSIVRKAIASDGQPIRS